ncbi:acyl-CoA thioesterase [Saccharospirillum mangrovi]|uniref:acyl-CoA thioesterase n=1 Tax=Saccharospirillum mangrovi TaxID=2161747 RepID=UPI000D3AE715|nr:thioesterase family protein [Saccharospirillum mangrovi]
MTLDELLAAALACGTQGQVSVPDSWGQGRSVLGGLSAAMAFAILREQIPAQRPLRALSVSFVGPLATEQDFGFQTQVLRSGKNVTQAEAKIVQGGQVCVALLASFGDARDSVTGVTATDAIPFDMPAKPNFLPHIPGVTPQFFQHLDMTMLDGGFPFSGSKTSHEGGFMRFKAAPKIWTEAHLIALIDTWPPTLLQQLKKPAPASTLTWNLEFLHPHRPVASDAWFAYRSITRQAGEGYGHTDANVWDEHGELIVLSRQTITVFA